MNIYDPSSYKKAKEDKAGEMQNMNYSLDQLKNQYIETLETLYKYTMCLNKLIYFAEMCA